MAKTLPRSEDIANLTEAFELFTQKTAVLEKAYASLKSQFENVNLKLAETNRQLQSILSNMSQGLLVISEEGLITAFNPAAAEIFGVTAQEILQSPFAAFFSDNLLGFSLEEALRSNVVPADTHVTYRERELEVGASLIHDDDAGIHGLLILVRDVTQLLQLQRLNERQDRLAELGEMAASVAHEIRNPLGGIEGWASLLKRDLVEDPQQARMAGQIIEGVRSLNRLVSNILHYSRPVELVIEAADITQLLKDTCQSFEIDPHRPQGIKLIQNYPQAPLKIETDRTLLRAVVLNLLLNAYQASEADTTVRLTLTSDGTLTIEDEGCGIPPENLEKIFSPFFTTKHDGHGFGLSEVYRSVQLLGGHIEVDSVVGEGTCFTLRM